jgi:hypothetical protein
MTVRAGDAEVLIENTRDFLRSGQTLFVTGDPLNPQRAYRVPTPLDDWDRWNESRDRELARNDSYRYVSRDIYGAEDLSDHGQWVYDAPYGWVWVPRVDAAWAPYRVGRWSWIDYYGWTWVSGDPWGWAPYHYGRWYYGPRYGWAWYPGGPAVRYTWRPALVAFFGWGTNIGWVPLAPYEVYRPWYGLNRTTVVNNVTVINHIDAVNSYHNARFISGRSGVTSLASTDFWRHRTTVNNYVIGTDRDFNRASDAARLLSREPDRGYRQPLNRRDDGRSNIGGRTAVSNISPSRSSDTARRTPSGRDGSLTSGRSEPARTRATGDDLRPNESNRGRTAVSNVSPSRPSDTMRRTPSGGDEPARGRSSENSPSRIVSAPSTSRQPVETVRRNEPSRVRTFESSAGRTEAPQSPRRIEETPNRSEPRRGESATIGRSEPSRGRSSENERSRMEPPRGQPDRARTDSPQTVRTARPDDNGRPAPPAASQGQSQSQQPQGNPGRGRGNSR